MTSVEAENQPVEDSEAFVAMEKNGAPKDPQVAVSALDEVPEEGAVSNGEREAAAAGDDLSNPHVFKMAAREVDEGYMSVIRGLSAFSREDEEVCRNAVDICKDIIAMEQSLFSEVPSYVTNHTSVQRAKTDAWNKALQPHWTIPTPEGPPRTWEEKRAYVDPGVPLMLPYSAERFKKEHPERALVEGTYHNLFYGDGTQVVFPASADNKRKQIEEEQRKHPHPSYHRPYVFKLQQKKPMRVAPDFVPSCAEPENPRASLQKPVKKEKTEKSQKKVTSK